MMALRVIAKEHFMVSAIISDVQEDFSSFVNELEADEARQAPAPICRLLASLGRKRKDTPQR
jgi:hypothetical protein